MGRIRGESSQPDRELCAGDGFRLDLRQRCKWDLLSHNFNLNSSYKIAGFQLHAGYVYSQTHGNYPLLLSTQENEVTDTNVNSFSLGATDFLPLHGSFSANFNHSDLNTNFFDSTISKYSASVNTVTSAVSLHPTDVWMLGATFNYTDKRGTLYQSIGGASSR